MEEKLVWIKYRHKFASGVGDGFEYEECYNTGLESFLDGIKQEFDWSDKYRGVEYEFVDVPPRDFLEQKISYLESDIDYANDCIKRYGELLKRT